MYRNLLNNWENYSILIGWQKANLSLILVYNARAFVIFLATHNKEVIVQRLEQLRIPLLTLFEISFKTALA